MGGGMEKKSGTLLRAKIFKKKEQKSYKLVLLLFSYHTTARGGRNNVQVVSEPYQEARGRGSQLLVILWCKKYLVMKERDPATFTDLKQFRMLSSDPHLCFSIHKRCFCSIKHLVNALDVWAFQPAECSSCSSSEGTAPQENAVTLLLWLSSCFKGCKSRLDIKKQTIYSAGKNVFMWLKNVDLWNSFSMVTKHMFFVRTWWWCVMFSLYVPPSTICSE